MKKYRILNGMVYTEQNRFEDKTVYMAGERILEREAYEAREGEDTVIDASGCYVIPGLTDIHFHGCAGSDACDGTVEAFRRIARYEGAHGITTITPATMTVSEEQLMAVARAAAAYREEEWPDKSVRAAAAYRREKWTDGTAQTAAGYHAEGETVGAVLAGLYLEGPFISAAKKGAQNERFIRRPDAELFQRLNEASNGCIRTIALAPEVDGALEFIRAHAEKVNISLAHMTADYETTRRALEAGASQITHLYNAMPGFHHREPGPIGAAADDPSCMVELICDGIHIHPAVVRATFRLFGEERVILISDSLRACGMPDGEYELGGQHFQVRQKRATLPDGTLAGSASNLMDCLRAAVKTMGIPLSSAVRAAAVNSAKVVGIFDEYGSLEPGKYANLVILDQELCVREVYIHGQRNKKNE
ncbi:MAG: N-acetylglucosamine-6-phosphate deacetylase [Clostridiales bacterium]|nr:N-acetylglucosamine-6-phosphate deacetylase [Clostridiales bacterium]